MKLMNARNREAAALFAAQHQGLKRADLFTVQHQGLKTPDCGWVFHRHLQQHVGCSDGQGQDPML